MKNSLNTAIIMAAGSSSRMGGGDKLFAEIGGKPVIRHTVEAFQSADCIDEIIIVANESNMTPLQALSRDYSKVTTVVKGGGCRAESVMNGVNAITHESGCVAIHDGARPMITPQLIDNVVTAGERFGAAILAVPIKDTVKRVSGDLRVSGDFVESTLDRSVLYSAQTPQVFDIELYRKAVHTAKKTGTSLSEITDDSMLFERAGIPVKIVEGSYSNIKITTPEDLRREI